MDTGNDSPVNQSRWSEFIALGTIIADRYEGTHWAATGRRVLGCAALPGRGAVPSLASTRVKTSETGQGRNVGPMSASEHGPLRRMQRLRLTGVRPRTARR